MCYLWRISFCKLVRNNLNKLTKFLLNIFDSYHGGRHSICNHWAYCMCTWFLSSSRIFYTGSQIQQCNRSDKSVTVYIEQALLFQSVLIWQLPSSLWYCQVHLCILFFTVQHQKPCQIKLYLNYIAHLTFLKPKSINIFFYMQAQFIILIRI